MPAKQVSAVDPYATLGLEPGVPMAEVKRAYRRLAKAFHPDSAGEQAIPRFLAIQAAYEQIRTGRVSPGGPRGGRPGGASGAAPEASEPWRADPARARAARERARTGPSSGGQASAAGAKGEPAAGGRRATGTSGSGSASGSGGSRRRATRKATMGSTSYDEARDPSDATWSGASWYGPSTGEYWIVNPREYADPRKHGPDYQQRARRPLGDSSATASTGAAAQPGPEPDPEPVAPRSTAGASTAPESTARRTTAPRGRATSEPVDGTAHRERQRATPRWSTAATKSGWSAAGEARPPAPDLEERAGSGLRWLGEPADDPFRRLGQALVAWPPIGLVAAALIGEATGCLSFSAACDGAEPMLPWLAQAVILGLLLLVPPVTRILAAGTIAILIGVVPATSLLLAVGAAGASEAQPALAVLLGVLWLVGVAWATAMRVRRSAAGTRAGT